MTWYVIDGMDGSGKSTAGSMVKGMLESRGRRVLDITHPTEHRLAGRISDRFLHMDQGKFWEMLAAVFYILDVVMSLFYVRRYGKAYDDVIFIRYSMAVAYVPTRLVPLTYRIIESVLPIPDVKILIDIDPGTASSRIDSRGESRELFETPQRLMKTRNKIMMIADSWHIVENTGSMEDLECQLSDILDKGMVV